jgi:hypothetical protein
VFGPPRAKGATGKRRETRKVPPPRGRSIYGIRDPVVACTTYKIKSKRPHSHSRLSFRGRFQRLGLVRKKLKTAQSVQCNSLKYIKIAKSSLVRKEIVTGSLSKLSMDPWQREQPQHAYSSMKATVEDFSPPLHYADQDLNGSCLIKKFKKIVLVAKY